MHGCLYVSLSVCLHKDACSYVRGCGVCASNELVRECVSRCGCVFAHGWVCL